MCCIVPVLILSNKVSIIAMVCILVSNRKSMIAVASHRLQINTSIILKESVIMFSGAVDDIIFAPALANQLPG